MKVTAKGAFIGFWAVAGTAVLGVVGATALVKQIVDAEHLADVMNRAIGPATQGRYRIEVDDVEVSPWTGDLEVQGVRLRPTDFGGPQPLQEGGRAVRFSGDLTEISIHGARLWPLVFDRHLEARSFLVEAPRLGVIIAERSVPSVQGPGGPPVGAGDPGPPGAGKGEGEADPIRSEAGDAASAPLEAVTEALTRIQIDEVAIRDVNVTLVTLRRGDQGQTQAPLTEQLRGLSLTFEDLLVDATDTLSGQRFLFSRDVRFEMEGMEFSTDKDERVEIGSVTAGYSSGTFGLEHVTLTPGQTRTEFLAGAGPDGDRVELSAGPISIVVLEWRRLFEDLDAVADTVRVDSLTMHILSDKHRSKAPRTSAPAMPHDVIRELPTGLSVDVIEVAGGHITYAERGPESVRPGSVTFADLRASVTNLTNDPVLAAERGPTMVEAQTRVFNAVPVGVRASLPLLGPAPTMFFFADIGGFDAGAVNAILPDLEGIRVTGGTVDSARVDIRYRPGGASGEVMVAYSDLSIRQQDRASGEQSVGQAITSFLANTFVINGSNQPDDDRGPDVGAVEYETPEFAPFFMIFWQAIRDGLIDLIT